MRVPHRIGVVLGVVFAALVPVATGAHLTDGSAAVFPGGPFRSGQWVELP